MESASGGVIFSRTLSESPFPSVRGVPSPGTWVSKGSVSLCGGSVVTGEASKGFFTSQTSMRSPERPSFSFSSTSTVKFIFAPFCP